jgi:hypothetical protein
MNSCIGRESKYTYSSREAGTTVVGFLEVYPTDMLNLLPHVRDFRASKFLCVIKKITVCWNVLVFFYQTAWVTAQKTLTHDVGLQHILASCFALLEAYLYMCVCVYIYIYIYIYM